VDAGGIALEDIAGKVVLSLDEEAGENTLRGNGAPALRKGGRVQGFQGKGPASEERAQNGTRFEHKAGRGLRR
jgi:hypothetical protein